MSKYKTIIPLLGILCLFSFSLSTFSRERNGGFDVFVPISKYLSQGNTERLSAWFADNLEISVLSENSITGKNQAKQILAFFFSDHTPRSFVITYTASNGNVKYALGRLSAGGEQYNVTIFVRLDDEKYKIQQLLIEKSDR